MKSGDFVKLGDLSVYLMNAAIHTKDHCLYCVVGDNQPRLFTGDTIQPCGIGELKEDEYQKCYEFINNKFKSLPSETLIYSGRDNMLKDILFASYIEPRNAIIRTIRDTIYFYNIENRYI